MKWIQTSSLKIIPGFSVNDIKLLIWGDGTLDGSSKIEYDSHGNVKGRFTTKEFKKLFPEKHLLICKFFDNNKSMLINRALFTGKTSTQVDYVYHGNFMSGYWASRDDILKYNLNNPLYTSTFNIGRLSFQTYNAYKKGTIAGSKKRGQIQFKYSTMLSDIQDIMLQRKNSIGKLGGDIEEFNFVKYMNHHKENSYWKILRFHLNLRDDKEYYIINIVENKYSNLANKKVKCKSDCYIIETQKTLDRDFLLLNQYILTEKNLKYVSDYKIVQNSGISIKMKTSKNFTYSKLSIKTFIKTFSDYIENVTFYATILLLYTTEKEKQRNSKILNDLIVDRTEFDLFILKRYNIKSINDVNQLVKLKNEAKKEINNIILNNKKIYDGIFYGKGWFEEPFCSSFTFIDSKLLPIDIYPYRIDNGSGRSRGIYTIIFKPH
ncbi:hypothetical protein ACXYRQ_03605 [Mycoplasma sp. 394]